MKALPKAPGRGSARHACCTAALSSTVALLLSLALIVSAVGPIWADARITYESPAKGEALRESVERALKKVDPGGFASENETQGFAFRLSNRWSSPFTYDMFGGTVSSTIQNSILRIEGDTGDVKTLARVLTLEQAIADNTAHAADEKPRQLNPQSHLAAQSLNLIAPWLSILYLSYDSPRLSRGQTWFRAITFFMLDALIVYAAGTDLFRQSYRKACTDVANIYGGCTDKTHPDAMLAALALTRLVGAWQGFNLVRGHNRLVELKYTFYLDY